MHDRVREYLEAKRAQTGATQARTQYQERRRVLLDAGLYERVYAPAEQTYANEEYPNREVDAQGRERFFKAVTYDVTDEEYEEIKGYVEADKQPSSFAAARASVSSVDVPKTLSDVKKKNNVAEDIWSLANGIKVVGIIFMVLCMFGGLIAAVSTEDAWPLLIGVLAGIGVYVPYWVVSRLTYAISLITQSTKTTADALLYKLNKDEK